MINSAQSDLIMLFGSLLLPALFLIVTTVLFVKKKQSKKNTQIKGLDSISFLATLIKMLQQHRGLTYGYLRGDETLRKNLLSVESSVQAHLQNALTNFLSDEEKERWEGFVSHWKRMVQNNLRISPENNLEQHNLMISNLLFLVEDLSESHCLDEIELNERDKSVSLGWIGILRTAEWVGQARALGTGIAASEKCSSVERIRIKFIRGKINALSQDVYAWERSPFSDQGNNNEVFKHLETFLSTLDNRLIAPSSPTVSASEYFDLATKAIDEFLALFDTKLT
jgi:hypothetical protein